MLKVRLRRMGTRNAPFYRVVVSDQRRVPKASAVEEIGYYDPKHKPPVISIDEDRLDYWVAQGALMSDTVRQLRGKSNVEKAAAETPAVSADAAPAADEATESAEAPAEDAETAAEA